ncbi:MAG: Zn-dependent hydrolase of the beta-lactamase fold-like protein [Candidatus Moranbacteria bacterium GW2011_GWE2_35_2-]|nr:MAG: Zn-dependent hydrolase of the beta-lactamase fold-like protein [Candidatus Moranbacteria bacterium GW2011_GWE2_35_2-]KKQ05017.1 MAG: Zn-dependent hydrolase of the beta-lactamase fold-like protein [Candidatus Moranbacteria bacterium GW2011_GWF1_36_4]KKQ22579.1 MAG: Zn-dependent hydrolase of the beta-lactamase fold-like protein [Candidatus Moranbacteria bacterium GW2011_GWF2_37_11]KKQ28982.1 MAG: Zn-dependent hydrolase of the beta-lactamase fold-like protein [Candidatus Moranbacteria bacte
MNIQYYGHSCFKINTKPGGRATEDVVFFFDPFDKSVGLKPPFGQADAVFVSHQHNDHNNISALKGNPVIIDTPGEFAVKGMNILGLETFHDTQEGAEKGKNIVFTIETEEMRLCFLGDLATDPTSDQLGKIGTVDILFIPIGGKYTLDGKKAAEFARKIEPNIIIPMHYKIKGSTMDVSDEKDFCAQMGNCPKNKVNKITLKKKDLEEKSLEIILMDIE